MVEAKKVSDPDTYANPDQKSNAPFILQSNSDKNSNPDSNHSHNYPNDSVWRLKNWSYD